MKKFATTILCLIPLVLSLASCDKKPEPKVEKDGSVTRTVTVNASDYKTWAYFSFSKGEVVNVTDYKNDTNWDIAIHRYDVRLNGGESGKGQGAAVYAGTKDFKAEVAVPKSGYQTDEVAEILVGFKDNDGKHKMQWSEEGINLLITGVRNQGSVTGGWLDLKHGQGGVSYTLTNKVFFVKAADGQVAKVQFTDYRDAELVKGMVKFQYTFPVK